MAFVRVAAVLYGLMGVVAWWLMRGGAGVPIVGEPDAETLAASVAWGLAAAAVMLGLTELFLRTPPGRGLRDAMAETLGPLRLPEVLALALMSGVAEELLFRGALQPRLGLVATALLFGLIHVGPSRVYLGWTAFAVAAGFLLGGLVEQTGRVLPAVVAHVLVNLVNLQRIAVRARAL